MLHSISDGLRLQKLRGIKQRVKGSGIQKSLGKILQNLSVSALVPLMHFHHPGENISVLGQSKAFHCFQAGEGLEPKFRGIPEKPLPVVGKRKTSVPYVPIVNVAPFRCIGFVEPAAGGRGSGPVEGIGILFSQNLR